MADDRATKLAKVGKLRRQLPHVSQSALSAILAEAKREPLPSISRRADIREARDAVAQQMTGYGRVQQQIPLARDDGTVWLLEMQAVLPMLVVTARDSTMFSNLMYTTACRVGMPTPEKPWRMILYADEVDPGNPLASSHGRKFWAVYWSIAEFGYLALSHEELWFTCLTARTDEVKKLNGGISAVVAGFLRHTFMGRFNVATAGAQLELSGAHAQPFRLFMKFAVVIADGDAIRAINCSRGAGGEMPCICCYNVKNAKSKELPYAAPGQFITHTELDVSKLRFHTDESVFILADRLQGQQPTQGVTQFKDTQKRVGLTLSSCALLWDLPMRNIFKPISCTMYDWMHCYMIDGVCSVEIGSLMASLKPHGITYEDIHVFLQHWHWPSRFGTSTASGKQRCGADHAKKWYKEVKFKPSASEMLSLYAVFAFFFTHVCRVPPACAAGVTLFFASV